MSHTSPVAPLLAALLFATAPPALAQPAERSAPQAIPLPPSLPEAQDIPFPGTIELEIDATDTRRGVFRVVETVPVPPGEDELILLLPEWHPGKHDARGAMNLIADVRFEVDGKLAAWTRDPIETYAFRIPLPRGAREVTARFVYTSPLQSSEGRIVMTQEMLNLQWEAMSLYPAGHYVRQIRVRPTVRFPEGWTAWTALDGKRARGDSVSWAAVDYETLVDSPVFAGRHARQWDLGHDVRLSAVADEPGQLALAPEHLATFEKLVDEALALYGARHFDHYDILLALTERMGGIGLEHHRSSENDYDPENFVKWDDYGWDRNVVAHELSHSWDGKYRRPAGLWTPDYRTPMPDELLWVYEGQDQLWGYVLAARSGLQPRDIVLGAMANSAGFYAVQPGRAWRSVEDTTFDPIIDKRKPQPFASLNRNEDYYSEGMLVWLEADQIIREGTGGAKGLDDFARAFFGMNDGDWGVLTYTFDDVVATLNAVHPYDWAGFFETRIKSPGQPAPLAGIEKAGYRLVWKEEMNPYEKDRSGDSGTLNLQYSLGVSLDKDGKVTATLWGSPAFDAGIVNTAQIVAVNGEAYSAEGIQQAITAAKDSRAPIELLVKRGERYLTVPVDYHGGLRWPWLEPAGEGEQGLDRLLAPRT
ncbi:MAG TPA: peptidase M61 [Croceibacterium sp.]|nr:peptidase M61 [Croceibacterium sp.]